jgi:hypothetical protein
MTARNNRDDFKKELASMQRWGHRALVGLTFAMTVARLYPTGRSPAPADAAVHTA